MAGYQYTTRNGQRLETNVAADFDRLRAAFRAAFPGIDLVVSSGTRTDPEQEAIFRARYVVASQINGRRVYDTRWWNGQLWYRISSAGTVAAPGTSNHQASGPNGPRSIDIRDTGSDAGVTVRGSRRDKWMEANAAKYEFENEGYKFGEPWHKTNRGQIGVYGGGGAPAPKPPVVKPPANGRPNPWSVVKTWSWRGIAAMLRKYYSYVGNNTPGMMAAFQRFLRQYGYTGRIDGIYGDGTAKAHQRWLKRYGYTGQIDAWMGAGTKVAHTKADNANWAAFPGYRR
jgi:hypothetical protein